MPRKRPLKKTLKRDVSLFKRDFTHHLVYTLFIIGLTVFILVVLILFLRKTIANLLNPSVSPKVVAQLKKENYRELVPSAQDISQDGKDVSGVIFHGPRDTKQIALTFDAEMTDGMKQLYLSHQVRSSYDKRIIDILNQTHTKATLFLTGMWIELYPEITKELAKNPLFELGSHSYTDSSYNGYCFGLQILPKDQLIEEVGSTEKLIRETTGIDNTLFRFPGGCYSPETAKLVQEAGDSVIQWDVVGQDGFNDNSESIVRNVVSNTQNGSIIVLHMNGEPTAPKTADALPEIISGLKAKGFEFVTVSQLLHLN